MNGRGHVGKISFEALSKFLDNYSPEKEKKQATTEEEKVEVKPCNFFY